MQYVESSSSFKYCGKNVTRRKLVAKTIFGNFEVFEAVSGKCFIRHPFLQNNYIGPTGFNNGCEEWFGAPKKEVTNIEHGKAECEATIYKIKKIVSEY